MKKLIIILVTSLAAIVASLFAWRCVSENNESISNDTIAILAQASQKFNVSDTGIIDSENFESELTAGFWQRLSDWWNYTVLGKPRPEPLYYIEGWIIEEDYPGTAIYYNYPVYG